MPVDLSTVACPLCGHHTLKLNHATRTLACTYSYVLTRPGVGDGESWALSDVRERRGQGHPLDGQEQTEEKCSYSVVL